MAEIEYMHICDYAFAAQGGKQCVIGIFDTLFAGAFPATHPILSIAAKLRAHPHERLAVTVEVLRPNGSTLQEGQAEIAAGPDGSAFLQWNLVGVQIPEPGRYLLRISAGGVQLASRRLDVVATQSAGGAAAAKQVH